jgi:hypothetical protein
LFINCTTNSDLASFNVSKVVAMPSILDSDIGTDEAINNGNLLMGKQVTVSKLDTEVYAHDSKLLIYEGVGYCAYYGNDSFSAEGAKGQSVRLSIFDIANPCQKEVFDVFKENYKYDTLITDANQPCYTPVLFLT